ncbi:hypothetical protein PYCC9005_002525 [Savitreella phatthalungensis]
MDPWTAAIHADDGVEPSIDDVAPVIHNTTTYRYADVTNACGSAVYQREVYPTVTRCERVLEGVCLTGLNGGGEVHAVVYGAGLSGAHALMVHYAPRRLFISRAHVGGYHGTLAVANILQRLTNMQILPLDALHPYQFHNHTHPTTTPPKETLRHGDLVWLESPINPTGEFVDVGTYAGLALKAGVACVVDATFGPPPVYDPFAEAGVSAVMHSATKYFAGHSDLLAGVVLVRDRHTAEALREDRGALGTVPSPNTAWLLLRSLRTFHMRIGRQTTTATALADRLCKFKESSGGVLADVKHSSLQGTLPVGATAHSPTFAILLKDAATASKFPSTLKLFHHATSLGGVESLCEWRRLSDKSCDDRLVRLSIGVENVDDLWEDLQQGLQSFE